MNYQSNSLLIICLVIISMHFIGCNKSSSDDIPSVDDVVSGNLPDNGTSSDVADAPSGIDNSATDEVPSHDDGSLQEDDTPPDNALSLLATGSQSYIALRDYMQKDGKIPKDAVFRTEELINYFKYDYPEPKDNEPLSVTTELVSTPWNKNTQLLMIGLQSPKDTTHRIYAKDVNFQVEFNPSIVEEYRIIGYEPSKDVQSERLSDDQDPSKDVRSHVSDNDDDQSYVSQPIATSPDSPLYIDADQQITFLYEITFVKTDNPSKDVRSAHPSEDAPYDDTPSPDDTLATVTVRYKRSSKDESHVSVHKIPTEVSKTMSENIQFASAVAELGMLLNKSKEKGKSTYRTIIRFLDTLKNTQSDPERAELLQMVKKIEKKNQEEGVLFAAPARSDKLMGIPRLLSIKFKELEVSGSFDKRIIRRGIHQHTSEIRACYEREFIKNKKLKGRIVLNWIIDMQGKVSKPIVKESTMNNKNVEDCVVNSIKFWRFPAPEGGGMGFVEQTILFEGD